MSEEKWSKEELNHSTKKPKLQSETHKSPSEEPKEPKPPLKNHKLLSWEEISSTKHQKLSRTDSESSSTKPNLIMEEPISSLYEVKSSRDQKPPMEEQKLSEKSERARASDLTQHVIGAVLNVFSALTAAVQVTALQLVSVNIRHS